MVLLDVIQAGPVDLPLNLLLKLERLVEHVDQLPLHVLNVQDPCGAQAPLVGGCPPGVEGRPMRTTPGDAPCD